MSFVIPRTVAESRSITGEKNLGGFPDIFKPAQYDQRTTESSAKLDGN